MIIIKINYFIGVINYEIITLCQLYLLIFLLFFSILNKINNSV